jgi:hypothetical protein
LETPATLVRSAKHCKQVKITMRISAGMLAMEAMADLLGERGQWSVRWVGISFKFSLWVWAVG